MKPESTKQPDEPPRLAFLDGLRALAALAVMLHHARLEIWPSSTSRLSYAGRLSVDVFIALSGFCLMLPVVRAGGVLVGGTRRFVWRRARRILPPFYAAMALSLLLIWAFIGEKTGSHWDYSVPVTWKGVLANVLMVQNIVHRFEINHVFWSIAAEWQIYFLFPLFVFLWRRLGATPTAAVSVAASLTLFALLRPTSFAEVTVHYVGLFTLGMLAASIAYAQDGALAEVRRRVPWPAVTVVLGTAALTLVALGYAEHLATTRVAFIDTLVAVAAMALVLSVAARPDGWLHALLSTRSLALIGVFSYSLYLVHAPLQQLIWQYALVPLHLGALPAFLLLAFVGCPAIVGFAYLFFLVAERPLLRKPREASIGGF